MNQHNILVKILTQIQIQIKTQKQIKTRLINQQIPQLRNTKIIQILNLKIKVPIQTLLTMITLPLTIIPNHLKTKQTTHHLRQILTITNQAPLIIKQPPKNKMKHTPTHKLFLIHPITTQPKPITTTTPVPNPKTSPRIKIKKKNKKNKIKMNTYQNLEILIHNKTIATTVQMKMIKKRVMIDLTRISVIRRLFNLLLLINLLMMIGMISKSESQLAATRGT